MVPERRPVILGSGGELTNQTSIDVACYIDNQKRPVKKGAKGPATQSGITCTKLPPPR